MKLAEIEIGRTYSVKVSGNVVPVVVTSREETGHFHRIARFQGMSRATGKTVRFTAAKCRRVWTPEEVDRYVVAARWICPDCGRNHDPKAIHAKA